MEDFMHINLPFPMPVDWLLLRLVWWPSCVSATWRVHTLGTVIILMFSVPVSLQGATQRMNLMHQKGKMLV